jgi:hypothetical protein
MVAMRRAAPLLAFLLAVPMLAQKPWEQRTDLDVTVPVELPALPTINPFARPLLVQPAPVATPLAAKFNLVASARGTAYVNGQGGCQRVVFSSLPLPFVGEPLHEGSARRVRPVGRPADRQRPGGRSPDLNGQVKRGPWVRAARPRRPGELPGRRRRSGQPLN